MNIHGKNGVFVKQIFDGDECSVSGCGRPLKYLTPKPICRMHYQRWWQYGSFDLGKKSKFFKPRIGANGYMVIRPGHNEPQVQYHRYIMEKHIGRKLKKREHIHHIDGDKTNNDIYNLEVMDIVDHNRMHTSNRCSN